MKAQIGLLLIVPLIMVLFRLARERNRRSSSALWIPVIWLAVGASRNPSEWLHLSAPANGSDRYLEGNPLDRTFLSALILIALVVLFRRQGRVAAILSRNWPILLYLGYCAVSALWSDYGDVSFKRWF